MLASGLSSWQVDGNLELFDWIRHGATDSVTSSVRDVTGDDPQPIEDWLSELRGAFAGRPGGLPPSPAYEWGRRRTATERPATVGADPASQSSSPISAPSGLHQPRSTEPRMERPWNQRRLRSTGCSRRSAMSRRVKSSRSSSTRSQSYQEISLSWQ